MICFWETTVSKSNPVIFSLFMLRWWNSFCAHTQPEATLLTFSDKVSSVSEKTVFVSRLIRKGFRSWLQRNDFPNGGLISTPLPLIFFFSRIPPALILQDFCVPLMSFSVGLDNFPSAGTEPAKKLQATALTLWNLLCLMVFMQGGLLEAFCLLFFLQHFWAKTLPEQHFEAARSFLFPCFHCYIRFGGICFPIVFPLYSWFSDKETRENKTHFFQLELCNSCHLFTKNVQKVKQPIFIPCKSKNCSISKLSWHAQFTLEFQTQESLNQPFRVTRFLVS